VAGHAAHTRAAAPGGAVQVVPMKPVLKAPCSMLLKLRNIGPLSNFGFYFNLRRYTLVVMIPFSVGLQLALGDVFFFPPVARQQIDQRVVAGAYTRPLFSST